MRRSTIFLAYSVLSLVVLSGLAMHASFARREAGPALERNTAFVKQFRLTDLSLFTEARYTRNPSVADLNSAFQDYPFSFEHFPSGSLVPVPPAVRNSHQ
ncbi:MAG: hypothetical protein FIA94_01610 [Nitrospirae bacterium]|nr:hypothetical protein [Nitrospirota bacterium]